MGSSEEQGGWFIGVKRLEQVRARGVLGQTRLLRVAKPGVQRRRIALWNSVFVNVCFPPIPYIRLEAFLS